MDYFVRDSGYDDGAVVEADQPVDAAQRFIDIVRRSNPGRYVNPYALDIFPIRQRNRLIDPVDPLNGDRES